MLKVLGLKFECPTQEFMIIQVSPALLARLFISFYYPDRKAPPDNLGLQSQKFNRWQPLSPLNLGKQAPWFQLCQTKAISIFFFSNLEDNTPG